MEAPTSLPVVLASPQKRTHNDDVEPTVSTPNRAPPSNASTPLSVVSSLQTPSPLKPESARSANPFLSSAPTSTQATPASSTDQQPAKRRRLTQQEKEEQAKDKEAKAKARADKKAQKEAEEKLKADQKAQKDEEKRKKNEEKEEKKRARELKQQQEEEDKKKKERSQLKLNAFFSKPKGGAEPAGHTMVEPVQKPCTSETHLSSDTTVGTIANAAPPSPQKAIIQNAQSDYERVFLPFSLPPTGVLAPLNAFYTTPGEIAAAQARLEDIVTRKDVEMEPVTSENLRLIFSKRQRGLVTKTVADIVDRINGSADHPIDLTEDPNLKPLDLLRQISMKYLHFGEDVRPPYFGTYTRPHRPEQERKVSRNPIFRGLEDLNYDYDSEAEWEEPGEGEDLDSDGEEDLEEDGEEDLDGFLDDEDDPEVKRRLLNGDQEPVSTGLCWEDSRGVSRLNDGSGAISTEFKDFQMGFLLQTGAPIDPLSDSYWAPEVPASRASTQATLKGDQPTGTMNPPRLPLTNRPVNGLLNTLNGSQKPSAAVDAKTGKVKRMVDAAVLPAFKAEIAGSDLTKIGMIEALKKKFPKIPKDAITNTLTEVAQRIGPSAAEKRWVLFD